MNVWQMVNCFRLSNQMKIKKIKRTDIALSLERFLSFLAEKDLGKG